MNTLEKIAILITALMNTIIVVILAWMFFVLVDVLTLPRFSVVELTTGYQYKPGDFVRFQVVFCKYTDHETTIIRQLIGDQTIPLLEYKSNIRQGCYDVESANIALPDSLSDGEYLIRSTYIYQVNPIRKEIYVHETEHFTVSN